jgi:hypothetical protein
VVDWRVTKWVELKEKMKEEGKDSAWDEMTEFRKEKRWVDEKEGRTGAELAVWKVAN